MNAVYLRRYIASKPNQSPCSTLGTRWATDRSRKDGLKCVLFIGLLPVLFHRPNWGVGLWLRL